MSSPVESLVRPFSSRNVSPPRVVPYSGPTPVAQNVKLWIGRVGVARTFHGSASLSTTVYVIKYPTEQTTDE